MNVNVRSAKVLHKGGGKGQRTLKMLAGRPWLVSSIGTAWHTCLA